MKENISEREREREEKVCACVHTLKKKKIRQMLVRLLIIISTARSRMASDFHGTLFTAHPKRW